MIGQIKSYISLMDENSPSDLVNRIYIMINNLPNDMQKSALMIEYKNKKEQIEQIIRSHGDSKKLEELDLQVKKEKNLTDKPNVSFEDEINKKVKEYLEGKMYNLDIIKHKDNYIIKISPDVLLKLGSIKIKFINQKIYESKKIEKIQKPLYDHGIPVLPIYEEKNIEKKQDNEFLKDGTYKGKNNVNWIFEKGYLYQVNSLNNILNKYIYSIDNSVLSLKNTKGNIILLKINKINDTSYKIYENDTLIDEIIFYDEKKKVM